jgi:hypothetical protein
MAEKIMEGLREDFTGSGTSPWQIRPCIQLNVKAGIQYSVI